MLKYSRRLLLACLALWAGLAHAQSSMETQTDANTWYVHDQPVSTTAAQKVSKSAFLYYGHFNNTSSSSITITLTDLGAGCNGSPCQVWTTITIGPVTSYEVNFNGVDVPGGLRWTASASGVNGFLRGRYF